jgi:hypothetical protein
MAAQLAARIEEKAVGLVVGEMVEEGLALALEVVFQDLADAPAIAQKHFALLTVERLDPFLLEEKDTVVSCAAERGDATIATRADQTGDGPEDERRQGRAHQLL